MEMRYCDSESVRNIIHGGMFRYLQERHDHELDLLFCCCSVSGNGLLYFPGRIFMYRQVVSYCGEDGDSARVPELEGRLRVLAVKGGLDCHFVRSDTADNGIEGIENLLQSLAHRR